jgi:hypothetical protein
MRIIRIISVFAIAFVMGCSDAWWIDQEAKTPAGSVSSIEDYLYEGSCDGAMIVPSLKCPHRLRIEKETDKVIDIGVMINPEGHIVEDVVWVAVDRVALKGRAGDVCFDQEVDLRVSDGSNITEPSGRISGWLKKIPFTKTSPDQPDLDGHIELSWTASDKPSVRHVVVVDKIISRRNMFDYFSLHP